MRKLILLLGLLISFSVLTFCCNAEEKNEDYRIIEEGYESTLPVLYINVEGGSSARSQLEYKNAYMKLVPNEKYADATLYEGDVQIKARGNATYQKPKKPYKIKLDKATDLFGFGKSKHWVLLAQYFDESLMRNKLAYDLAGKLGLVSCESVWVDVVFNGKYIGVYQLCEQIKIGDGRINITDWEEEAESIADAIAAKEGLSKDERKALEDQMQENLKWISTHKVKYNGTEYNIDDYYTIPGEPTGGIIFEIAEEFDEESKFRSDRRVPVMIKEPEYANTNDELFRYAEDYINAFERALFSKDGYTEYNGKKIHYSHLGDIDSFVKTWLVAEFTGNRDATFKSRYMYLNNDGSKLVFGPVWDYDLSMGAVNQWHVSKPRETLLDITTDYWFRQAFTHPYFTVRFVDTYYDYIDSFTEMSVDGGLVDQYRDYLSESYVTNEELWRFSRGYEKDAEYVKTWLTKRLAYFDERFENIDSFVNEAGYRPSNLISLSVYDKEGNRKPESIGYDDGCYVYIDARSMPPSTQLRVYINGIYYGNAINLEPTKYALYIEPEFLSDVAGHRNVITVWSDRNDRLTDSDYAIVVKDEPSPWYARFVDIIE